MFTLVTLLLSSVSQLSKEVAGLNMNFPLQVNTDCLRTECINICLSVLAFLLRFFSFRYLGLNARYESEHSAVHVSSQPHGQSWSLRQPGGKDEEETAHDAAL